MFERYLVRPVREGDDQFDELLAHSGLQRLLIHDGVVRVVGEANEVVACREDLLTGHVARRRSVQVQRSDLNELDSLGDAGAILEILTELLRQI